MSTSKILCSVKQTNKKTISSDKVACVKMEITSDHYLWVLGTSTLGLVSLFVIHRELLTHFYGVDISCLPC